MQGCAITEPACACGAFARVLRDASRNDTRMPYTRPHQMFAFGRKGRGMKISLQQMRYMLTIAETGSLVSASRVLSISQPSLSEAVSVVERELGFSVFSRGNTGATPTKEGLEFFRPCAARGTADGQPGAALRGQSARGHSLRRVVAPFHVCGACVFGRDAAGGCGSLRLDAERDANVAD